MVISGRRSAVPLSLDASLRHPIHVLDSDNVVLRDGHSVVIIDVHDSNKKRLIDTEDCIGAIAMSDDGLFFAIGGKSRDTSPKIVIYASETLEPIATLQSGALRKYDALDFDKSASILASVSGDPDYMLTLWNWRSGDVILRSKAFSQEVFTVKCSRLDEKLLITSGTGHIKFWTMADTFTGMKLQGRSGKFGKVELMDIPDFVELGGGHSLCGTDSGELLLWRDCMIKVGVLRCQHGKKCHEGSINCLTIDTWQNQIVTASSDGSIKTWDANSIVSADAVHDGTTGVLNVVPLLVVDLRATVDVNGACPYGIMSLARLGDNWIVCLSSGGIVRVPIPNGPEDVKCLRTESIWNYGSGGIVGMDVFGRGSCFAAAFGDGTISLFDIRQNKLLFKSQHFSAEATCLALMPSSLDPESRYCIMGFQDGTVRILKRCLDAWKLTSVMKAHKAFYTEYVYLLQSLPDVSEDASSSPQ